MKSSFQISDYRPTDRSASALMFGTQLSHYLFGSSIYLGVDLNYAKLNGTQSNVILDGGALAGIESIGDPWIYGLNLSVGGSHITQFSQAGGFGLYLKPEIFAGVMLGNGWRLAGDFFYQSITTASEFSGLGFGLKFEFKFDASVTPLND